MIRPNPSVESAYAVHEPSEDEAFGRRQTVMLLVGATDMRDAIAEHLLGTHYSVQITTDCEAALAAIRRQPPDLLLFDSEAADTGKSRFIEALRVDPGATAIPIIQVLRSTEENQDIDDSSVEPDDYLAEPLVKHKVLKRISNGLELGQLRQMAKQRDDDFRLGQTSILENLSEAYVAVDAEWRFTYVNASAEQASSKPREELIGESLWELFPEVLGSVFEESYRRAMRERVPTKVEGSLSEPEGWFTVNVVPLLDGGLGLYFRNAIQEKDAEAAALASERRLRLFLEHAKDYALALLDPDGRVLEWLGGAEVITGWSADERVGKSLEALFTADDLASGELQEELSTAARFGRAEDVRWHQKKDGTLFFAHGATTAFHDDEGCLQGFGKIFRDATSQELAEEALKQSREQLQLILTSAADGIYGMGVDGRCIFLNPAGAQMLGYSPDELVGRSLHNVIHHHGADGSRYPAEECRIAPAVREGIATRVDDEVFWHKDGTPVPVHYSVNPMIRDGNIAGAVIAFTDVTERKRAEAALHESERRLRFVMDSMPQKIFTATPTGDVNYYNPVWTTFSGLSFAQLQGSGWTRVIHPSDLEENLRAWRHAVESTDPFEFEHRLRNAGGKYRWHLTRALPMRDLSAQVVMWVGSTTDIHDVKTAEVDLGRRLAVEQHHAALLADVAAASRAINAVLTMERISEVLVEEVRSILCVQHASVILIPDEDSKQKVSAVSASESYLSSHDGGAMPLGAELSAEVCRNNHTLRLTQDELVRQIALDQTIDWGESRPRGLLAVPLIGHGGRNLGLIQACDKMEEEFTAGDEAILTQLAAIASIGIENAKLYASLLEQDRRKDEFLAMLAHELRNPLAPLRTGLEILELSSGDEQSVRICEMMSRQLTHMVRLVDDLMDVSRVSRGKVDLKKEKVSIQGVLAAAVEGSRPFVEATKNRLEVVQPDELLYVDGDHIRLAQVVGNLLNNAAKYTPAGGTIALSADVEGGEVVIRVRDTGVGIARAMLPKVFDLFSQADTSISQAQGGLGIGLSLVKKLVELHGGSVTAESPGIGQGSTFTVRLPLLLQSTLTSDSAGESAVKPEPARHRILVVDDNVDAAEALATLLRYSEHEVETAYSGADGLTAVRESHPDIVFLDLGLPDISGYDVAKTLRDEEYRQDVVIIALTGWGSDEDRRQSRMAGFDFHLVKPVNVEAVEAAIEESVLKKKEERARRSQRG